MAQRLGDPAATALADLDLGRVLGRGVSGRVLRVKDQRTAASYALKTIEKSHIKGEAQLTNLYREKVRVRVRMRVRSRVRVRVEGERERERERESCEKELLG
jgi:hypothetical protein